jgi:hypothetical protein
LLQETSETVADKGGTIEKSKLGAWQAHQGDTYFIGKGRRRVKIEPLPPDIPTDPKEQESALIAGQIGSYPETREIMLQQWCGVADLKTGSNSRLGIADDVADGNSVIAVVDVNRLPGSSASSKQSRHAVIVSQMDFDDDGKLKTVTMNDTSGTAPTGIGCGRKLTGKEFAAALIEDGSPTNVIPPGK